MKVLVLRFKDSSTEYEYEGVVTTWQEQNMFCMETEDEVVMKWPLMNIFSVTEFEQLEDDED